ncbi:MAG: ribonuclease HI [Nitrososphaerales archaeon]
MSEKHTPSSSIVMNFDGLCEPRNPGGVATYGVVIKRGGKKLFSDAGLAFAEPYSDEASNNVAEYSALIHGLEWLLQNGLNHEPTILCGDSRLVVNQMKGEFKVKARRIVQLYFRAKELASEFDNIRIEWVDRSTNTEADLLSRIGYSRFLKSRRSGR